jgi:hypothetical protein
MRDQRTVHKSSKPRVSSLILAAAMAILSTAALTGCKAQTITTVQTTTQTMTKTVTASTSRDTTQPKLNTTTLNLAVVAPAEYASATVPVYIKENQIIHLNWTVVGGPIRMGFSSPNGKVGSVGKSGVTTASAIVLDFIGEVKFSPTDDANKALDWGGSGYYYFIPNIAKGDLASKVTISFWIEG